MGPYFGTVSPEEKPGPEASRCVPLERPRRRLWVPVNRASLKENSVSIYPWKSIVARWICLFGGKWPIYSGNFFLCWKGVVSLAKDIKVMSLYWPSLNLWNWDVWCVYKTFGFYAWQENLVARHHVATLCMLGYDVRWLFKRTATEDLRSHWIYIPQNEPSGCPPIWEVT